MSRWRKGSDPADRPNRVAEGIYLISFKYNDELITDNRAALSAEQALDAFQRDMAEAGEWWDFHSSNDEITRVRTAFISGVRARRIG